MNKHTAIRTFHALGYACHYCQTPFYGGGPAPAKTVDHKIPRSRGGTNASSNKVVACYPCNHTKGNMTDVEYVEWLRRGRPNKKAYLREIGL